MNAVVPTEQSRPVLASGGRIQPIVPQNMEDAYRLAKAVCEAGMAPRGMDKPAQAMIAIMRGLEIGLTPFQALDKIAVVNGRPTIWGDGAMALVRGSGLCEFVNERIDGEGDRRVAICETKRRGEAGVVTRTFSVAEAKEANLWNKPGPWKQFPARMLQMRARAFALRDLYADVLGGLYLKEEIEEDERQERRARADEPPPPPRRQSPPAQQVIGHQPESQPVEDARFEAPPAEPEQSDDGVVSKDSLLTELDERMGFAKTADEVEEAYTDFDAEALLSDYEGGVEAARKLKAQHLDRVPASQQEKPAAPPADDDFPGNDAIEAAQASTINPALASTRDPFAIPALFKGGGHYQTFIRDAVAAAKAGDDQPLRACWSVTKAQRDLLRENGQLADSDVKGLLDAVKQKLADITPPADEADDLPPPPPRRQPAAQQSAAGDPIAAYTARLTDELARCQTQTDVQKFWFGTADDRDASGASDGQRNAWKTKMQDRRSALPAEG